MICNRCKEGNHHLCPAIAVERIYKDVPSGLSPEGDKVQRSGLCPCHHRVSPEIEILNKIRVAVETESMIQVGKK